MQACTVPSLASGQVVLWMGQDKPSTEDGVQEGSGD